jgi:hypothetical protein
MNTQESYQMPASGWTCFHCGETFTTPGSAQNHFGNTPAATAGCRIKAGDERGLLMELRKSENRAEEFLQRALAAEREAEALYGELAEFKRVTGEHSCSSLRMRLDYMRGLMLLLEEAVAQ